MRAEEAEETKTDAIGQEHPEGQRSHYGACQQQSGDQSISPCTRARTSVNEFVPDGERNDENRLINVDQRGSRGYAGLLRVVGQLR